MADHPARHAIMTWALRGLSVLAILAVTAWSALALYFGDNHTGTAQSVLAALFVLAGLAALIGQFIGRWRHLATLTFFALFAGVLAWWFSIAPSNQRDWQADVAQLPYAEIKGDQVTVHNIRNFSYRTETDYTPAWDTRTYDLSKLDTVDLFATYWMGPDIAHVMVSFGFAGQDYLTASIEARKERGEGYSSLRGFFRQYELTYIVADERDIVRLRTNYRKNPIEEVHLFRLKGEPELVRQFFLGYMKSINAVRQKPRFYNTLTSNCTNLIWAHARMNPRRIPFSWKILLSGHAPSYLYDQGRLDTSLPFDTLMKSSLINAIAQAAGDASDFSQRIRTVLHPAGKTP